MKRYLFATIFILPMVSHAAITVDLLEKFFPSSTACEQLLLDAQHGMERVPHQWLSGSIHPQTRILTTVANGTEMRALRKGDMVFSWDSNLNQVVSNRISTVKYFSNGYHVQVENPPHNVMTIPIGFIIDLTAAEPGQL